MMATHRFSRVVFSSISGKHRTPHDLFLELDKEFHFNFDPCNPPVDPNFVRVKNGLLDDWPYNSRAYLNPDYEKTDRWVGKTWMEIHQGRCEFAVFLLPARTDTNWFDFLVNKKADFRKIKGRVTFEGSQNGAPFPSLIIILRKPAITSKLIKDTMI